MRASLVRNSGSNPLRVTPVRLACVHDRKRELARITLCHRHTHYVESYPSSCEKARNPGFWLRKTANKSIRKSRHNACGGHDLGSRGLEPIMQHEKRFYRRSRIPESKFRELVRLVVRAMSATEAATLVGLTRKSVTEIFLKLRRRIAEECERSSPVTVSRMRQDTSRAFARCVCGRCRPGVSVGGPIFGVFADQGKVFTQEIPDCRKPIPRAVIRRRIDPNRLPVDGWDGYDALVDAEFSRPFLIQHAANPHTNSERTRDVESFWGFARHRLQKFNGVPNRTFNLHLKESEWRFNLRGTDLYSELLNLIEKNPL